MPTLADGAQRAISQFGLGEPIDLDELRDPSKRKLHQAKAAGQLGGTTKIHFTKFLKKKKKERAILMKSLGCLKSFPGVEGCPTQTE